MGTEKRDFFVSYNNADEQWAVWIAAVLEENGYSCYIQAWDFRPGGNFVLNMNDALINSERFIAVLSPNYFDSKYCPPEWAAAFTKDPDSKKRLLIPVRVADIKPVGLFAAQNYIDLFGVGTAEAEKRLVDGVKKYVERKRPDKFPGEPTAPKPEKAKFPGTLPSIHNLPYDRNPYFTARDTVLENICAKLESGKTASLTQTLVGMGGFGKTQTALEYAYRYAHNYNVIWWVHAETDVLTAYRQFAVEMKLVEEEQQHDSNLVGREVLKWMQGNPRWLFVYDNVEPDTFDTALLPKSSQGNVLITTRNQKCNIGEKIDISVFKEDEAVGFLEKRTGITKQKKDALALAKRLGYFPLALEQAAAYIKEHDIFKYSEYLSLLDEYGLELLDETDGVMFYTMSTKATLEISINKITLEAAKQLLYLCSYLAPDNITEDLFTKAPQLLPQELAEAMQDRRERNKVWKQLTTYGLLKVEKDEHGNKSYVMHRLLQEIVQEKIEDDKQWALSLLAVFNVIYKFVYGDKILHDMFLQLTLHVEALINNIVTILLDDEYKNRIAHLYNDGGIGYANLGYYSLALAWYQEAMPIYEKVLGKEHQNTAAVYNNIAEVYYNQGNYTEALELYQKAIAIDEKVSGTDHPHTATSYNNIATVYKDQGNYDKALELYQKALVIRENVLGENHPEMATICNNIAVVYHLQGKHLEAMRLYKKALKVRKEILNKAHPHIAMSYNNIAMLYEGQGNYCDALKLYKKAIAIFKKGLGEDHPLTKKVIQNMEYAKTRLP